MPPGIAHVPFQTAAPESDPGAASIATANPRCKSASDEAALVQAGMAARATIVIKNLNVES